MSCQEKVISFYATALALTETGFGTTLQALRIPFSGTFLSLNQTFLITRCLSSLPCQRRTALPLKLSCNAAAYKCLFPEGRVLIPALAICMQGALYNLGTLLLGNTVWGRLLGGTISSLWSLIQPLFFLALFFGAFFPHATELEHIFSYIILTKLATSALITLLAPYVPLFWLEKYLAYLSKKKAAPLPLHPLKGALLDLCKPLFVVSYLITALCTYFSFGASSHLAVMLAFPLIAGFLCFFLIRLIPVPKLGLLFNQSKEIRGYDG